MGIFYYQPELDQSFERLRAAQEHLLANLDRMQTHLDIGFGMILFLLILVAACYGTSLFPRS